MAAESKIQKYGLGEEAVRLHFEEGHGQIRVAEMLTASLPEEARANGESISQAAVSRYLAPIKAARNEALVERGNQFLSDNLPGDLELLNELQAGYIQDWRSGGGRNGDDASPVVAGDGKARLELKYMAGREIMNLQKIRLEMFRFLADGDARKLLSFLSGRLPDLAEEALAGGYPSLSGRPDFFPGNNPSDGGLPMSVYQEKPAAWCEIQFNEEYTDDVREMMRSVVDHPVTVARSANATGKTHAAARVAAWFYKCFPGAQVFTAAAPPEANLKTLLWGEINSLVHKFPDLFTDDKIGSLNISRGPQEFITGVTIPTSGTPEVREGKFSGKHAPSLLFILDEGDAIPDEVYRGIESCISGGHARLLVMFNPRGARGAVRRMEEDGDANVVSLSAFRHPNVIHGEDRIPGAVTRAKTVERINKWCRPLAEGEEIKKGDFALPEFLEGGVCKSSGGKEYPPLKGGVYRPEEPAFYYMVLGEYPPQSSHQLIPEEAVQRARARWNAYVAENGERPPAAVAGVMGHDVADSDAGDDNAAVCRWGGFVSRIETWTGMNIPESVDKDIALFEDWRASRIVVDGNGVGAGVAPALQRMGVNAHECLASWKPTRDAGDNGRFYQMRDQLFWSVREWLKNDPSAMLPPDDLLTQEILQLEYEVTDQGIKITPKDVLREALKRSPDRLESLAFTFYEPETAI